MSLPSTRAQEEGALDVALAGRLGLVEDLHDVLEAAHGRVDGLLELTGLELVLHQPGLRQEDPQLLVALGGHLVGERRLDAGVVAAYDPDRTGGLAQRVGELADVRGGDAVQLPGLRQGVPAADPQLALAAEPELAVLTVGARQQVNGRLVTVGGRLQDQDAVLGQVAGEVRVLDRGAEGVLGVVRAGLQVARGNDQALAREARGERGTPGGGVLGLRDRLQAVQLRVGPAGLHALGQLVGHARVQAVLALLDRLFGSLVRGLRIELVRHGLPPRYDFGPPPSYGRTEGGPEPEDLLRRARGHSLEARRQEYDVLLGVRRVQPVRQHTP